MLEGRGADTGELLTAPQSDLYHTLRLVGRRVGFKLWLLKLKVSRGGGEPVGAAVPERESAWWDHYVSSTCWHELCWGGAGIPRRRGKENWGVGGCLWLRQPGLRSRSSKCLACRESWASDFRQDFKVEFSFAYSQAYSENRLLGHDLGMWGPAQHALSHLEEYRLQEKVRGDCCSYFQTVGIPPTWTEAPHALSSSLSHEKLTLEKQG